MSSRYGIIAPDGKWVRARMKGWDTTPDTDQAMSLSKAAAHLVSKMFGEGYNPRSIAQHLHDVEKHKNSPLFQRIQP